MKDITLITDKPIRNEDITRELLEKFKAFTLEDNSEDHFFMSRKGKTFEIYFTPGDKASNPEFCMDDVLDKLPNRDGYLTSVSFSRISTGKKIVEVFTQKYKEVYVDDNDFMWFGTAEEFLNSTHQEESEREIVDLVKNDVSQRIK